MAFYRINEPGQPKATAHFNFGRRRGPLPCMAPDPDTPTERCARMAVALCDGPAGVDLADHPAHVRCADVQLPPHVHRPEPRSLPPLPRQIAEGGVLMPRHRTQDSIRVGCSVCRWEGHRIYRGHDNFAGKPAGFGTCPKCSGSTLARVITRLHHVRKTS